MKVYIIPTIFIILIIGNVIYHVISDSNAVIYKEKNLYFFKNKKRTRK